MAKKKPADGTVVNNNVPSPESHSIPLLHLESEQDKEKLQHNLSKKIWSAIGRMAEDVPFLVLGNGAGPTGLLGVAVHLHFGLQYL